VAVGTVVPAGQSGGGLGGAQETETAHSRAPNATML